MTAGPLSDEAINAFVDGEADAAERERIFAAASADPVVERRIAEARRTKALLAHSYDVAPPVVAKRAAAPMGRVAAVAAVALLGAALLALNGRTTGPVEMPAAPAIAANGPGVVIQVADRDPGKWRLAMEQAEAVAAEVHDTKFDVVVIAYGPGLDMLRGTSSVRGDLERSLTRGVRFVACGNTMERNKVAPGQLAPGVTVAPEGATVAIVQLQRLGYAYVRI